MNKIIDNPYPTRKSPRAKFHDYSGGEYFITICTAARRHHFGEIRNGEMLLSRTGRYCHQQLENVSAHYPYAEIPLFVVMPNHIHAIVVIHASDAPMPASRYALSVVVGGIKRAVTLFARKERLAFGWQSRFHDHIIRGIHDGNNIANYIQNNVAQWSDDCFNQR